MSWRTERSRWIEEGCRFLSSTPIGPRKYLDTTTLVAVCDHARGTSTSPCSNTTRPSSPVMTAVRSSQSTSFMGSRPGLVKNRSSSRAGCGLPDLRSVFFSATLSKSGAPPAIAPPPLDCFRVTSTLPFRVLTDLLLISHRKGRSAVPRAPICSQVVGDVKPPDPIYSVHYLVHNPYIMLWTDLRQVFAIEN